MTITGDELVRAMGVLAQVPSELKGKTTEELKLFFQAALLEADVTYQLQQKIDDAIKLQPGLEELSDIIIQQVYETALPIALSELVHQITGGSDVEEE